MIWFAGLIGLVVTAVLLTSLTSRKYASTGSRVRQAARGRQPVSAAAATCPLCRASLGNGRRLYSAVFPGDSDRIMHVFGCPECYPKHEPLDAPRPRKCPVCCTELTLEDYLIARMFPPRPGKPKPHVHVLGCTQCRRRTR